MAVIKRFLCWTNTRTGSAICGYYTLVVSVLCLAFYMLKYIAFDDVRDSIELKGIVYAGFILYSFLIGVSLILLPGVYMDRKFLLLPWIYVLVITVLYESGAIALITTVHLEQNHTLETWEIIALTFYFMRLIANCYCFACVVSQYQELSEGRGTYEFLYKASQHQMAREAFLSELDDYQPPYGASLPPYSQENPFKQFSPPNSEHIVSDYEEIQDLPPAASLAAVSPLALKNGSRHSIQSSRADNLHSDCVESEQFSEVEKYYNYRHRHLLVPVTNNPISARVVTHNPTGYIQFSECNVSPTRSTASCVWHQGQEPLLNGPIAMTYSSASLVNTTPADRVHLAHKANQSHTQRCVAVSPLIVQKRTYITWI